MALGSENRSELGFLWNTSPGFKKRLHEVVELIQAERELQGADCFRFPRHRVYKKLSETDSHDLAALLANLQRQNIVVIDATLFDRETGKWFRVDILRDPEIHDNNRAMLTIINPGLFNRARNLLRELSKQGYQENNPEKEDDEYRGYKPESACAMVHEEKGYFSFPNQRELVPIGSTTSRHFRLLKALSEPNLGVRKTYDSVFESIRIPKDNEDHGLARGSATRESRSREIIEYAKKELQKISGLKGKLDYREDKRSKTLWLELK